MPSINSRLPGRVLAGCGATAMGSALAAEAKADLTPADGVLMAALLLIPLALVAIRSLVLWRLRKLMMMKAVDGGDGAGAGADGRPAWTKTTEVAAPRGLRVDALQTADMPAEADAVRERWVASALAGFRKLAFTDAAVAAGYLLLPALFGMLGGSYASTVWDGSTYALLALLIAAARYGAYCEQFRAHGPQAQGLVGGFVGGLAHLVRHGSLRSAAQADPLAPPPLWRLLLRGLTWPVRVLVRMIINRYGLLAHELYQLLSPRVRVAISVAFIAVVFNDGMITLLDSGIHKAVGAGLVTAALLHALAIVVLWLRTRSQPGARLLVLRVFDIDANAEFTFGGVLAFWRHFGNYFTVVDRSVWRHGLQLMSRPGLVLVLTLLVGLLVARLVFQNQFKLDDGATAKAMVGLLLLAAAAGAWWSVRWLDKGCIRSREHLLKALGQLERQPRGIDLAYKPMQVSCHDNTWRVAVDEFARRADAVLMDLRGISASNQGCADEVDFLLDTVPLHKILFLVDAGTDQALVHRLLLERWQMLDGASPNLRLQHPAVRLYVAHVQDPLDIQCILDLLMLAADPRTAPAEPQAARPAGGVAAAA